MLTNYKRRPLVIIRIFLACQRIRQSVEQQYQNPLFEFQFFSSYFQDREANELSLWYLPPPLRVQSNIRWALALAITNKIEWNKPD